MKLKIVERIEQHNGILITDYAGDVANLLMNKPKPYRIVWNSENDVYGVGDAYKFVHGDITAAMIDLGYNIRDVEFGFENGKHIVKDEGNHEDVTFVPTGTTNTSWEIGWFEGERSNPTYIQTGAILTGSIPLEDMMPDLYKILERRGYLSEMTLDDIKSIIIGHKKTLQALKTEEKSMINVFRKAGYKIRPTYKGYKNLRYSLGLPNKHSLPVRIAPISTLDLLFYPSYENRDEQKRFDNSLKENGLEYLCYDFNSNMAKQRNEYEAIVQLLDDNDIDYELFYDII